MNLSGGRAPRSEAEKQKELKAIESEFEAKINDEIMRTVNGMTLDLCLIVDLTDSMQEWIDRCKDTLTNIVQHVSQVFPGLKTRVSFVGYRDFTLKHQYRKKDFTVNLESMIKFIDSQRAHSEGNGMEKV